MWIPMVDAIATADFIQKILINANFFITHIFTKQISLSH